MMKMYNSLVLRATSQIVESRMLVSRQRNREDLANRVISHELIMMRRNPVAFAKEIHLRPLCRMSDNRSANSFEITLTLEDPEPYPKHYCQRNQNLHTAFPVGKGGTSMHSGLMCSDGVIARANGKIRPTRHHIPRLELKPTAGANPPRRLGSSHQTGPPEFLPCHQEIHRECGLAFPH